MPLAIGNSIGIPFSRRAGGGGFDPDYQAVLDYANTEGYTLPSSSQQALQNQLVVDLKTAGVWGKLDSFSVFATDADSDFALIDWIRLIQMIAVSSPTFTPNQGWKGDGVSAYIDTQFNPSVDGVNFQQNSASIIAYVFTEATDIQAYVAGNISIRLRNVLSSNQRLNTSVDMVGADGSGTGVIHLNRTDSINSQLYKNGLLQASTTSTSIALDNINTRYLSTPSFGGRYGDAELSIVLQGSDLSAEQGVVNTAIQNYISAI